MRSGWACAIAVAAWGLGELPCEAKHRFAEARALIVDDVESGRVPAFAVAVARGDDILWKEAFGAATTETMFSLASVSKPFTATALMVLVERGAVDLDRPVNDYLGEARVRARVGSIDDATVRRVANHTSGLPVHHHFFPFGEGPRPPPMADTIRRYGNLVTVPGERWEYSNLGYGVLEHLIERVSQRDFATFLEEAVFRPLGMDDTALVLDPETETRSLAARYDANGRRLPFYDFDHRGASAIFSSAGDLLRFGMFHVRALESGRDAVVSKRALREMQEPGARMPGGRHYGIGWMVYENRWDERVVAHGGDMPGVSASLYLVPDRKIVVVALASTRTELDARVTDAVVDSLLGRFEAPSRRVRASASRRPKGRSGRRNNPKSFVGVWHGAVDSPEGAIPLTLAIDRDRPVRARLGTEPEVSLASVSFEGDRVTVMLRAPQPDGTLLRFSLHRREGGLSGAATILADDSGWPLALSHWVELAKDPASR